MKERPAQAIRIVMLGGDYLVHLTGVAAQIYMAFGGPPLELKYHIEEASRWCEIMNARRAKAQAAEVISRAQATR